MDATRVNAKKPHGSNFHLRITAESQQNRSISEADSDEKWVTYDNVKRKRSWSNRGEPAQTVAKPGLTIFPNQEGFAVCLVGLAGNHLL